MRLEHITELGIYSYGIEDIEDIEDIKDSFKEMKHRYIVIVKMKDGEDVCLTHTNINEGCCHCCGDLSLDKNYVEKADLYLLHI